MSLKYPGGFITKSPVAPSQGIAPGIWTLDQAMQLKKQGVWPPLVPGAPTIGTATATSSTTATVVYTAPASNGGSVITSYTATSSPSGGTGTLSQAGSGTITVTGLTPGTPYTFTVTATNAVGTSAASAASNSVTPATVPGAPTIGTATTTGSSTATVAYTAPASDGGSVITSYTATSSPSGGTGTLSQAGSGTITVSGLAAATSYTFTVTATNAVGTSAASAASNSITTALPAIGSAFGGGFFAGQIGTSSVATYNLVIGPAASAQSTLLYKDTPTAIPGADSDINGPQNTADMVADGNSAVYPCAHFCNDLVTGGFSDWYMPAKNELEVCYFNLKPTTTANSTSSGINPNAVPARASNYTSGNPAQTSASNFITSTGAEAFTAVNYWSSTEFGTLYAKSQNFNAGYQRQDFYKDTSKPVRAIRRVAV